MQREVLLLEVNVNHNTQVVSVWLTNADQSDTAVQQELKQICADNKARKYKTAVFRSGTQNLVEKTQSLLSLNRYKLPQSAGK